MAQKLKKFDNEAICIFQLLKNNSGGQLAQHLGSIKICKNLSGVILNHFFKAILCIIFECIKDKNEINI